MIFQDEDSWSEPHCWRAVHVCVCVHVCVLGLLTKEKRAGGGCQTKPSPLNWSSQGEMGIFSASKAQLLHHRDGPQISAFFWSSACFDAVIFKVSFTYFTEALHEMSKN